MSFHELRVYFYYLRRNLKRYFLLKKILIFGNSSKSGEMFRSEIEYLKQNGLVIFPYPFERKYKNQSIVVKKSNGLPYVEYFGNKMFFQKSHSADHIKYYFNSILMEQDEDSPHKYCTSDFKVEHEDIIVDLGVAEWNFSLDYLDKAKKVLLFESNPKWIEALKKSFESYSQKVEIINKEVSNISSDSQIALDDIPELRNCPLFIKIDVDGSESLVLEGMINLLKENREVKIAICTYHKQNDSIEFEFFFRSLGYQTEFSIGYMLFYHDKKLNAPYFRKGVLRAWKAK